jgi:hypothetical protein
VARFRNRSADALFVPDLNKTIGPDETVDVDGDITELEDAYQAVGPDGEPRLWPKTLWSDATPATKRSGAKNEE